MPEQPAPSPGSRILIVDDEPAVRSLLAEVVTRAGYTCLTAQDGSEAVAVLAADPCDVVVTDIRMPRLGGLDLVRHVREHYDCDVIVMTAFAHDYEYEQIIAIGAAEFILKPCRSSEFVARLRMILRARSLRQERDRAGQQLARSHADLRDAYLDTIRRLSVATEFKDLTTGAHIERLGRMSALLADAVGLDPSAVDSIRYAAPMHDVGKIGIPDTILLKRGALTAQEFAIMKTHTTIGARILAEPRSAILSCAQEIVLTHHEQWDGGGYPAGLAREDIPVAGRIVKLADVFDALMSVRPYKRPYPFAVAVDLVRRGSGTQFDPAVVAAFLGRLDDARAIHGAAAGVEDLVWSERDLQAGTPQALGLPADGC
jgi:putative two-component system response regulator